jgi:hypothetical protein
MAIPFETVASGANPTNDSLLLPVSALYGITGLSEFGNSTEEDDSKLSASIFQSMQSALSALSSPLGVSQAKPNPTGAGTDIIRQNIALTWGYVTDLASGEVVTYPPANAGDEISVLDVFSGAEVVATASSASADSIAIAASDFANYTPLTESEIMNLDLSLESRTVLESLTRMVHALSDVRTGSQASATQAKTRSNLQAIGQPNNFFANTTFSESDAPNLGWANVNYSITHEYALDPDSQQYDVNVVTS